MLPLPPPQLNRRGKNLQKKKSQNSNIPNRTFQKEKVKNDLGVISVAHFAVMFVVVAHIPLAE